MASLAYILTSLKCNVVAFSDGRSTAESMPSPPLANSNHESPVNQLGNMQNMRLEPSFILTGVFLDNDRIEASPFFRDEFVLGKIFPEYKRNLFWKFQTKMASSLELDPPSFFLSVLLFVF
ncbi:PREDICTED: LOW QUALITY PROTEIN: uncharacterized protein C17orf112 homolog [Mandrillus leucophaeus]|uniref:LOW QUALITY PROTEIN: uncharacterized protein C17orf112 homolog n=1 Tax=Mandrillus leucophaeus TaxID=9568 RepID=UPI0005F36A39|nr:PREDICTED: LOW QUALITY PROTEIN: uncharacterized protein C17orf112 homolog [Mandrillus leucophaeus]